MFFQCPFYKITVIFFLNTLSIFVHFALALHNNRRSLHGHIIAAQYSIHARAPFEMCFFLVFLMVNWRTEIAFYYLWRAHGRKKKKWYDFSFTFEFYTNNQHSHKIKNHKSYWFILYSFPMSFCWTFSSSGYLLLLSSLYGKLFEYNAAVETDIVCIYIFADARKLLAKRKSPFFHSFPNTHTQ